MSVTQDPALMVTVFQKSVKAVTFQLTQSGAAFDLTGLRVYLTVWDPSDGVAVLERFSPGDGLTITSPATLGEFVYTPADSAELGDLEDRDYLYEVATDDGAGVDFEVVEESSGQIFRVCRTRTTVQP